MLTHQRLQTHPPIKGLCHKLEHSIQIYINYHKSHAMATCYGGVGDTSMEDSETQDLDNASQDNFQDENIVQQSICKTECLRQAIEDKCWLQCNELNRGNLKTQIPNRKFRRGGGLAIVHKSNIEVKCIKEGQLNTFQFAIWKARFNNDNITLIAIYHPPYSTSNPFTNTTFIDEYTAWLTDQIGSYDNLYITGDFNIHVNNTMMDDKASAFVDSMEALGLEQHCNFITHKACNTLDLGHNRNIWSFTS